MCLSPVIGANITPEASSPLQGILVSIPNPSRMRHMLRRRSDEHGATDRRANLGPGTGDDNIRGISQADSRPWGTITLGQSHESAMGRLPGNVGPQPSSGLAPDRTLGAGQSSVADWDRSGLALPVLLASLHPAVRRSHPAPDGHCVFRPSARWSALVVRKTGSPCLRI